MSASEQESVSEEQMSCRDLTVVKLCVGKMFAGRGHVFTLICMRGRLGTGGFAKVYLVYHHASDKMYARKGMSKVPKGRFSSFLNG